MESTPQKLGWRICAAGWPLFRVWWFTRSDPLCQGSPDCLEDPTILSGSLRSTLDVFEEYNDVEIVSYMPRCLVLPMMTLTFYISMKHFVVSNSSHPKTPLLKRLTWSMPMFSGTWTLLYQKEAITFPQGQYFANQDLDFLLMAPRALQWKTATMYGSSYP